MESSMDLLQRVAEAAAFRVWADGFADEIERTGRVPEEVSRRMRAAGYFGITVPKEYGGLGLGLVGYSELMSELSKTHAAVGGLTALNNMVGSQVLLLGGSEQQKNEYLPKIASGEVIAAFALTEPGAGSDAGACATRAVREGDEYVFNGMKHLIMHAPIADLITVIARTEPGRGTRGLSAFLVHRGTPGLRQGPEQKAMASRTTLGELHFDNCRVPAANMIGEPGRGFSLAMRSLDMTRVGVGAYTVGSAQRLLELSVEHARGRQQFGQLLSEFQGIQWMLAEMATDIEVARAMLRTVARRTDEGSAHAGEAAMLKLFSSEMGTRVADKALQIHGGIGYLDDHPVSRFYRDVRVWRIVDGTSEIQKTVIARDLFANTQRYV